MLDKEHNLFRRNDQSTQDADCLARELFYADLHRQVSGGLLSVADAKKAVEDYNNPQPKEPKVIPDNHLGTHRFLGRIEGALSLKHSS